MHGCWESNGFGIGSYRSHAEYEGCEKLIKIRAAYWFWGVLIHECELAGSKKKALIANTIGRGKLREYRI
jgi:hypothetical protein